MTLDVVRLRALASAATPGPWRWGGNTRSRELYLSTVHHGRRFIMTFGTWRGGEDADLAQPRFRSDPGEVGHMIDAAELVRYEVLGDRTMQAAGDNPYRHDVSGIDHPDADYIAAASPDVILALLEERAELETLLLEWLTYTGLRQRAFDPALDPDDDEYASGRALINRTDAALLTAPDTDRQPVAGTEHPPLSVARLLNEVDCRLEHGAPDPAGHLRYVRAQLLAMVAADDAVGSAL